MSQLRPDAKEFVFPQSRSNFTTRILQIRSRANRDSNIPLIPNNDLEGQQLIGNPESSQLRHEVESEVPQFIDQNRLQLNRELPEQQSFEGGHDIQQNEQQIVNDQILEQRLIQESIDASNSQIYYDQINRQDLYENRQNPYFLEAENSPYKTILDDFKIAIEVIIHDPAEFNSALELLLLDLEAYFENELIMDYVATVIIDTGWDVNFHYLAAKMAFQFATNSKYFLVALRKAVNNELEGQLLDISSFSLLISEFFCVFPTEFVNILFNCMDKLFEEPNRYDHIKIICKILKLNALKLNSFNSAKCSTLINKLKAEKPKTDHNIQVFIDHTLSMIEREHTTTLNGNYQESEQPANEMFRRNADAVFNDNSQCDQQISNNNNQSNTLFNMYGISDTEDSGVGGVLYGPDLQPLSEEELIFLNDAAAEADLTENLKHLDISNDKQEKSE